MKIKTFISIIIISLVFFASTCFATDNSGDMMNSAENGIQNVTNGAENAINGAASGVGNVVSGIAGGIGQGINNMGEGIQNMTRGGLMSDNNGDYTATRTAATGVTTNGDTFLGMNATTWGWLIMAIVGAAIVGLVWFYGKQHEDGYNPNHEDNY